jgi:DNA mismatch repair ATPase MutS
VDNSISCVAAMILKDASESVLTYLNHLQSFRIIAATHDIELSTLLEDTYKVDNSISCVAAMILKDCK